MTDATIVGRAVGATVSIVRHDETRLAEVLATRKSLETAGVRLAGCVLNAFDPRKAPYGKDYAYSYRYRYETKGA